MRSTLAKDCTFIESGAVYIYDPAEPQLNSGVLDTPGISSLQHQYNDARI